MGLKRAESQLQILLADTIWAMCKNTLSFSGGIRVEGLIGVTIDEEEIFLIPVNQKISKEVPNEVAIVEAEQSTQPVEYTIKRNLSDSQNDSDTSDSCSDSSDSDSGDESKCTKDRKKKSKRKRKRRRRSSEADVSAEISRGYSEIDTNIGRPMPGSSFCSTEASISAHESLDILDEHLSRTMKSGSMMVIKPEAPQDDEDSRDEVDEDLVIVKSEFGSKKTEKASASQNTGRWGGSGGLSHQQMQPSAHLSSYVNDGGHAAAILQHLSSIQGMASMQYPAQAMSMCAQSPPQHFMNQSRPRSFDGHSQQSSSQSPVAQNVGDHGDGFHLTRKRTSFSPRQIAALEQAFTQHGHYMNAHERSVFARSIGLTEKVVTIWFQNRRQKLKKTERPGPTNNS